MSTGVGGAKPRLATAVPANPQPGLTLFPNHTILRPDGTLLDVSWSQTAGIQEVFDLSVNLKADVHVAGGGDVARPGAAIVYRIHQPIFLPPMQGRRVTTGAVTWAFGYRTRPGVFETASGLVFDSCMMVNFDFNGQIVYFGRKNAVEFRPSNPTPVDTWMTAIVDSSIHFTTIVCIKDISTCAWFSANGPTGVAPASITNSRFVFDEINGGALGISFQTPSSHSETIARNFISCQHIHGQTLTAVRIGDAAASPTNALLQQNSWQIIAEPNGGARGVETNGSRDLWDLCVPAVLGTPSAGLVIGPHAAGNVFLVKQVDGGISDLSSGKNRFL